MDGALPTQPGADTREALPGVLARCIDVVGSRDPFRRIRLLQWVTAGGVYAVAAGLMYTGIDAGWMDMRRWLPWVAFTGSGVLFAYVALRTGWSERLRDPSLTQWQIVLGIVAVSWGYLICGPMRTLTLFPLLLIFAFGAFALEGRRIARLAFFACLAVVTVTVHQAFNPSPTRDTPDPATLPLDWINLAMCIVLLLALAVVAARLSALRANLHAKRTALARALEEVHRLATTDELTGLPNRRSMIDRLVDLRAQAGRRFCIAIIDIDHFKRINDTLGHAQGDAVLWRMADLARSTLADGDVLARWGGEEFLLLMPDIGIDEALGRVGALQRSLRDVVVDGRPLTFSAGVACHRVDEDVSGLVLRADRAMYDAKQAGRDRAHRAD